ncbi:MAG: hypothetical protein HYY04_01500 [Chloroflexi bacterium]|nr:hypothetical protein [Chloroflexota bacterium]
MERLRFGDTANSVMGALAAALRAVGEDVPYEYLMGASGAAFRIQVYQDGLCPSSPNANCGFNAKLAVGQALSYEVAWTDVPAGTPDENAGTGRTIDRAALRQTVVDSIERGLPVLFDHKECGLAVGCERGVEGFLSRSFWDTTDEYGHTGERWPWAVGIIRGRKAEAPDRSRVVRRSLELAVELARTPRFTAYASGFAAWDHWVTLLVDDARFEAMDPTARDGEMLGNAWIYESLIDARSAAATYLTAIAAEVAPDARSHLLAAVSLYRQLAAEVLAKPSPTAIAPYPWTLAEGQRWTADIRRAQVERLREARELDRQAVAAIERALKV